MRKINLVYINLYIFLNYQRYFLDFANKQKFSKKLILMKFVFVK